MIYNLDTEQSSRLIELSSMATASKMSITPVVVSVLWPIWKQDTHSHHSL